MFKSSVIAAYTSLTLIPVVIEFLLWRYQRKTYAISNNDNSYYKCMFTSLNNWKCRQHIYTKMPCGSACSYMMLKDIVDFVSSATESVSLCMYLVTCYEICNALLDCHKQGKKVRVIVDERMWGCTSSKGRILMRYGAVNRVLLNFR